MDFFFCFSGEGDDDDGGGVCEVVSGEVWKERMELWRKGGGIRGIEGRMLLIVMLARGLIPKWFYVELTNSVAP